MKNKRFYFTAVVLICGLILVSLFLISCQNNKEEGKQIVKFENLLQSKAPQKGDKIAVMTTSMGTIKIMFFPEYAPKAVENFITLSEEGYYDGVIFHRVMNEFMIQGGDPTGTGTGGKSCWGTAFEDEFSDYLFNFRGSLSMANSGKNTNGSQFFINQNTGYSDTQWSQIASSYNISSDVIDLYKKWGGGAPWLDGGHTVFGQVFEGMDVVDAIAAVSINSSTKKPLSDVVIEKIEIIEFEG